MAESSRGADTTIQMNQIQVLSLAEGFFQSSVLFALLKLRIFERIGDGSQTLEELAKQLDARPDTLARLLNAGVVLRLLESRDGVTFHVGSFCRSVLLPSAGENYLGDWIRNLEYFSLALSKLDQAVMTSEPTVTPSSHLGQDANRTRQFTLAMHNYASLRGRELAEFLDTTGVRTLLDLGCGPGTYAFHLGMRNPDLQLHLLDLPETLEAAREVQTKYPIKNEVHYLPIDVVAEEIPGSYDMILVSNMLHMLGEKERRELIARLYGLINAGGSLVIQAQYLRDDHLGERWPIMLDLIQLCITRAGRNHSVDETSRWMKDAGFESIEHCSMTLLNTNSFLRGYKASDASGSS